MWDMCGKRNNIFRTYVLIMTTRTAIYLPASPLRRQVFKLAFPAVGEQFLNMLVGLVDTYLVGHISLQVAAQLGYGPAAGLTGVGLGNYVVWIITTLFMAGAVGSTALVARSTGARNNAESNLALRQSVLLGLALGVIAMVVMYVFAPTAMDLFGADALVALLGISYLRIASLSMPLAGLMFLCNAALRGAGDTRTPLLLMFLVNGINIIVSWLLVNGRWGFPAMGVEGAAWGMTIGRALGGIVVIWILLQGRNALRLDRWPRPDLSMLRRIVRVGVPTGAEMFVFQAALVVFARFITQLGTVPFAAHNTVITVESISFLPGLGFAVAATTLVGQSLGAQDPKRARSNGHEAFFQAALFMGFMGMLFILIPERLLGLLVDDADVVAAGALPLRLVGIIQPLLAANFVYSGALRGAGDTRSPLLIKLISPWLVRLPLALVLIPLYGLNGAWIAMSIDLGFQGVLAWWRFYGDNWERIKV
jgi:MATE family multidrug resistance protein